MSRGGRRRAAFLAAAAAAFLAAAAEEEETLLDPARVAALAGMLPGAPAGPGRPIGDRFAWRGLANGPGFRDAIRDAEGLLRAALPATSDDLYLQYSRTGNKQGYEFAYFGRRARLRALVVAECLEDKGRFLPALEETIRGICSQRTWVIPAHDPDLVNFRGTRTDTDLFAAMLSWDLATARDVLGPRLSPASSQLIDREVRRRVLDPFSRAMATARGLPPWLVTTNNWNAVCLAGVVGSALATLPGREERALFLAAAERFLPYYMEGFTADGYCSEGLGYWNFGFGHYLMLAETARRATGGRLDWLDGEKVAQIGRFARRMEIVPGVYPAFSDAQPDVRPDRLAMAHASRRFGLGLAAREREGAPSAPDALYAIAIYGFPDPAAGAATPAGGPREDSLRSWFPDAGVLVARTAPGGVKPFGVALKGGHNAENHNHNDVGSFVVALGGKALLVDPGAEVYGRRTFSARRYESKVINSWGHPVPLVGGQLQATGRQAAARILRTEFGDGQDTLSMDIRSAYPVPALRRLERTFLFSRGDGGSLAVTDQAEFASPQAFGTALITFSRWRALSPGSLLVQDGEEAVRVDIEASGGDVEVHGEPIKETLKSGLTPVRIGIDLKAPAASPSIRLSIRPVRAEPPARPRP